MPRDRPGDFTAALMDLGQLVCTPRLPDCPRCPLAPECAARRDGRPESYPVRKPKARPLRVSVAAADARRCGRALLLRREGTLLSGMWAYPSADGRTPGEARRRLARAIAAHGLRIERTAPFAHATHTVVNRRLEIAIYSAFPNPKSKIQNLSAEARRRHSGFGASATSAKADPKSVRWFRPEDLSRAAVPTLTRKIAIAAGFLRR
jgi:adenine-specific DNA glycosylase